MYTRILEGANIPISSSCRGLLSCVQTLKEVLVTDFSSFSNIFGSDFLNALLVWYKLVFLGYKYFHSWSNIYIYPSLLFTNYRPQILVKVQEKIW